ncbi:MAG: hypothetical protein II782_05885, partial [Oscillospiraceae bacterium]|nr:hypothetical protein [Oscillospiraceae bacterium]
MISLYEHSVSGINEYGEQYSAALTLSDKCCAAVYRGSSSSAAFERPQRISLIQASSDVTSSSATTTSTEMLSSVSSVS